MKERHAAPDPQVTDPCLGVIKIIIQIVIITQNRSIIPLFWTYVCLVRAQVKGKRIVINYRYSIVAACPKTNSVNRSFTIMA